MSEEQPAKGDDETYRAYMGIGQVAAAWSLLERMVDETMWLILGVVPEDGACVTAQIQSLNYKLNGLIALVARRGWSDLVIDLNRFSDPANKLVRERNKVVHTPIITMDIPGAEEAAVALLLRADKKLTMGAERIDAAERNKIAVDISKQVQAFLIIAEKIKARLASS